MKLKYLLVILLLTSGLSDSYGQVFIANASFEGQAQDATVPLGWHACDELTTPDILPGFWGVLTEAFEGETYMGLITRADGTYEQVGHRLKSPLKPNECFSMSLYLAHSSTYAGYNLPIKLRIWGGKSRCAKSQLLADTGPIKNEDWEKFTFNFFTNEEFHYLIFEAQVMDGIYFSYNGNVLIDAISPIMICHRAGL